MKIAEFALTWLVILFTAIGGFVMGGIVGIFTTLFVMWFWVIGEDMAIRIIVGHGIFAAVFAVFVLDKLFMSNMDMKEQREEEDRQEIEKVWRKINRK